MAAPNRPRAAASVTFRCHGHPHISGSHTKTIEFTRDADGNPVQAADYSVYWIDDNGDEHELIGTLKLT